MTFSVVIQRVSDGTTAVIPQAESWDAEDERTEWYWTVGNMGCDCNLGIQFGETHVPCGHSAYRLIEFRLSDGRVVPCEPMIETKGEAK